MSDSTVGQGGSEAVLFSGDPETGECSMDVFREDDPVREAEALRESCRGDFPGRVWAIAMNDAAREEMAARRMKEWGLDLGGRLNVGPADWERVSP